MSIEKFRPVYGEGKIKHEPKPFTMILNKVLQNCTDAEVLGVWCYLQSLPENWIVSPQQLMNHFGFGKEKCYRLLNLLIVSNLISVIRHRDKQGRLQGTEYLVLNGEKFVNPEKKAVDKTPHPEKQEMVKHHILKTPDMVKSNAIKENTKPKKENKSKSRLTVIKNEKATPFPDDLLDVVTERAIDIAQSKGLDYRVVLAIFREYCLKNNWHQSNWKTAFEKWVERERVDGRHGEIRSTVKEWAPGNPDYDRLHA